MTKSRHVSVSVLASASDVYAYVAEPSLLPTWAAGLAEGAVEQDGDRWVAQSPMGPVLVQFASPNRLGVLDHTVTLPDGERVMNPMRVIPDDSGCEVVFTVRQRPGMSEQQFEDDCRAVAADLDRLHAVMEGSRRTG